MADTAETKVPLSRRALILILTAVQNTGTFWNSDIMTMAGLCDDAEIGQHIVRCFGRLDNAEKTFVFDNLRSNTEVAA